MKKISYGLVGNGLLATHLTHYFSMEKIPYISWIRKEDSISPAEKMKDCQVILLPISDDSIESFVTNNPKLKDKILVHFSGALSINGVLGFHPLMTFSKNLYSLEKYRSIPFIGVTECEEFSQIFPGLKNEFYIIDRDKKALYHALCVLGGNFSTMLWQKVINQFESELNLPKEVLNPYIDQVCYNIKENPDSALTGPVKRQDINTIKKNIKALNGNLWKKIYKLFNRVYKLETK